MTLTGVQGDQNIGGKESPQRQSWKICTGVPQSLGRVLICSYIRIKSSKTGEKSTGNK